MFGILLLLLSIFSPFLFSRLFQLALSHFVSHDIVLCISISFIRALVLRFSQKFTVVLFNHYNKISSRVFRHTLQMMLKHDNSSKHTTNCNNRIFFLALCLSVCARVFVSAHMLVLYWFIELHIIDTRFRIRAFSCIATLYLCVCDDIGDFDVTLQSEKNCQFSCDIEALPFLPFYLFTCIYIYFMIILYKLFFFASSSRANKLLLLLFSFFQKNKTKKSF